MDRLIFGMTALFTTILYSLKTCCCINFFAVYHIPFRSKYRSILPLYWNLSWTYSYKLLLSNFLVRPDVKKLNVYTHIGNPHNNQLHLSNNGSFFLPSISSDNIDGNRINVIPVVKRKISYVTSNTY